MTSTGIRILVAWAVLVLAGAAPAGAETAGRGEALFQLCGQCHGPAGAGNPAALAPAIGGLPQWYVENQLHGFQQGLRGTHFDDIPGMRMRPMSLWLREEADVSAVAAYVASLPAPEPEPVLLGGDPQRGEALYAPCTACHGPDGAGNQAIGSPPLHKASDWYLLSSLARYKAGVRGWRPEDARGALMRPMSMLLPDEQAMKDVVAYIMTLGR